MTIKDAIDVAGLHTTWGDPDVADYLAPTNNSWDLTRTPGGSSGGGAAAVAAGLSFLEYGSDLVGSIRIPAALCGVYGLRPSAHTVPLAGFQPPGAPAGANEMTYLSTLGPLARTAEDLRTALAATAGPLAPCDRAYRWNLAPARHAELKEFRVGFVLDDDNAPVSSEASNALSGLDSCQNYFRDVDIFLSPATLSAAYPHDSRPFHERTIPTPDGELPYVNQVFWIAHAALVGLPAVVAPVGQTPAGLPVGVQVVGPQYDDDTAITFAELLAPLTVGSLRPPI